MRTSEHKVRRKDLCWSVRVVYVLDKLPDVRRKDLCWSVRVVYVLDKLPDVTWPREDVPDLGLIDEDIGLLRGEYVTPQPKGLRFNRINRILIPTNCNFFPEADLQRTPKLSVLGLEQFEDG